MTPTWPTYSASQKTDFFEKPVFFPPESKLQPVMRGRVAPDAPTVLQVSSSLTGHFLNR